MAKNTTIKNGTTVKFLGYSDGKGDTFEKGATLRIIGFDPEDNTYGVEDEEGAQDSLYASEFEVVEGKAKASAKASAKVSKETPAAPAKKAATKKAAKSAPAEEDEEEEEVAPAKSAKASKGSKGSKAEAKTEAKAKSKAKVKAEAEEEVIELPKFKMTASVKEVLAQHEDDALTAAHELAESSEKTVFTLGGVLAYIKRNDLHTGVPSDEVDEESGESIPAYAAGLKGFNAYVEDTLGIAARKADYYVNLYEKFSQITTESKIAKLGWTKLRELLPLELDKENVDEWLDYAKANSTATVKDAVTKTLVESGAKLHGNSTRGQKSEKLSMKLNFFDDQGKMVLEAIEAAREVIGEDATESQCIVHIVTEWMALGYAEEPSLEDEDEDFDDEDLDEEDED